jgi:maltose alpha-D-glucosyltransferase/alpha-amylase
MRRECPEISWGGYTVLEPNAPEILALQYHWRNTSMVIVHNLADAPRTISLDVEGTGGGLLFDVFDGQSREASDGTRTHRLEMEPYGYHWFRVGALDNALQRTELDT